MGTRGIMGVRIDGQDKLTYNHFDSYPSGLGANMVEQLKDIMREHGIDWLKEKARNLQFIDENRKPTAEEKERLKPYTNLSVSDQSDDDWYCLTRGLQGNFKATLEAGVMSDAHDFIKDSLFCEWGYIVNLDEEVFEVYQGFQHDSHSKGRYAKLPVKTSGSGNKYYPCALVATFWLDNIPDNFAEELEKSDEE